jgi:hypothetical protein
MLFHLGNLGEADVTIGDFYNDVMLERCPELDFRGAMYGMADAA